MKDIFKGVSFGDMFETKDGRKAVYDRANLSKTTHYLLLESDFICTHTTEAYDNEGKLKFPDWNDEYSEIVKKL
ncbi:MAG: hypothetical protein KBT03_10980 [Bacteroidales bacterium]|nr:hypothetical protein [Candidatus Scybalousia scybalohippi]